MSGAGKTTLAKALMPLMPHPRLLLDGDEMRNALELLAGGYDQESRLKLALTYARLCLLASEQGQNVICATISMFHEVHNWNRANLPNYYEVFLDPPEELIKKRDYKRVYTRLNEPVMGQSLAPQFPLTPDMHLTDPHMDASEAAKVIVISLRDRGFSVTEAG